MKVWKLSWFAAAMISLLFSCSKSEPVPTQPQKQVYRGFDASLLPEIRQSGITVFNQLGQPEDMLYTMRNAGANLVRLRLWTGAGSYNSNFNTVKNIAVEAHALGLKVLLSVHYSDTWADPGNQQKPAAWGPFGLALLQDTVYGYTKKIMQDIGPDMIQIGNEINNGFLWPDGAYSNEVQMKSLLNSAIRAVRDVQPLTKIMLHYAGHENAHMFYGAMDGLDFDIIGLSYYPNWHGKNLNSLSQSLQTLSTSFDKDIMIVETAYPFTLNWNDYTNNIIGLSSQILDTYPPTPQGQKDFLQKIHDISTATPRGIGFCYWGGEWVSCHGDTATNGSPWENQALWDFDNRLLPVSEVY